MILNLESYSKILFTQFFPWFSFLGMLYILLLLIIFKNHFFLGVRVFIFLFGDLFNHIGSTHWQYRVEMSME